MNTKNLGSSLGLTILKDNPAVPASGMAARITNAYNSGWQIGDSRGCYLSDTMAETIVGSEELVTNGTFDTDTSGWAVHKGTISASAGELLVDGAATYSGAYKTLNVVMGKTYYVSALARKGTSNQANIAIGTSVGNGDFKFVGTTNSVNTVVDGYFTATLTGSAYISLLSGNVAGTAYFDNISVKLAEPDRSVKNNGLIVNGTLTKSPVAAGSNLVAYSGFSASNYLEQPYNSQLDFGTGDFSVMGWVKQPASPNSYAILLHRRDPGAAAAGFYIHARSGGVIGVGVTNPAGTVVALEEASGSPIDVWKFVCVSRVAGVLELAVNAGSKLTIANTYDLTNTSAVTRVGGLVTGGSPTNSSLALWRISATAPSADQIAHIYRTELPLFQPNAKCTIDGTSPAVTALAHDDSTDLLHVGTSWGRTSFRDLIRVDSEATTTGSITSLSAQGGTVLTGGTSVKLYTPAKYLRDELQRQDEAKKALGRIPVFHDFTATASQTAFVAPKGFTIKAVYKNGVLMREATTGVYWTRSTDGFAETCTLSVGATVSDWISIMAVRS